MSAFDRFVGNADTVERLESMIATGRVPHAFIVEGAVGTGRKTLAKMLAKALACTGESKPCGACGCCLMSENPDIVIVEPEKSTITVDQIRKVREDCYVLPNQSDKRVFIIPDANLMNEQAQNALLKVFEEPPQRVVFILICEYSGQLLKTVVSRAAVFKLAPPSKGDAAGFISAEHPKYDRADIDAALDAEMNNIGRALLRLSGDDKTDKTAADILFALADGSELVLLKALFVLERDRQLAKAVLSKMSVLVSDALSFKMGSPKFFPDGDVRNMLAEKFTRANLLGVADACKAARADCDANCNGPLMVTNLCACIRGQLDL